MKTVFNRQQTDTTRQPLFFGEDLNMQRYDVFKYPVLDKLNDTMQGYFWRPQEISLQKDRSDFLNFRPEQKYMFTKNISYQILLDSVQGRAPNTVLQPICSNPELEGCIITWGFFEAIHSRAYTWIIRNLYPVAADIFDEVLKDEVIVKRAQSVTKHYDDFYNSCNAYFTNGTGTLRDLKRKLYITMININILEGIRFYPSFATTFAFAENKQVEGSAKNISLIARDESQHLALTQHIIKAWQKGDDPEMLDIIPEAKEEAIQSFIDAVAEEKEWNKYLFSEGTIIGYNESIANDYVEFLGNRRLRSIGFTEQPFKNKVDNLPWMKHWLNSKDVQNALMETESESYIVGGINGDIDVKLLAGFKL